VRHTGRAETTRDGRADEWGAPRASAGPGLPSGLWVVQAGIFLQTRALGWGAVVPFAVIYCTGPRIQPATAGCCHRRRWTGLALLELAGRRSGDRPRVGDRATAVGGGVALAAGYAGWRAANRPWQER